jgi:hypothetical protein
MILRLLGPQGIAGLAIALCLAALLLLQKGETRHWKRSSANFEQLYRGEQAAFAATAANYRMAAEQARAADRANAERARADQSAINERSNHALEIRLADARARAQRLRGEASTAETDPDPGRSAPMPGLPAPTRGAAQPAGEGRLPEADALIATEQAIQLDELIKWVRAQSQVVTDQVAKLR